VTCLEAHVALDNQASRGVAERAGFSQDEVFDDDGGQLMVRYVRPGRDPGRRITRGST
jgi:RimJ/RimL family protein N-acetyltransferase